MKKIFSLLLMMLPLAVLTSSCEHEEDDPIVKVTPYSKFKGTWEGTYSGGDSGTIVYSVKDDGSIIGDIESEKFGSSDLTLKGKVNVDGQVQINLIHSSAPIPIGSYTGIMTETSGNGSWINNSAGGITGSWIASKN
nr:hypothetical protein [uncultured Flavobacterium sp.]